MCCATGWIDVNVKHMTFNFPQLRDAKGWPLFQLLSHKNTGE